MASRDVNSSTMEDDRMSRIATLQFPMKLHVMLEESSKRGLEEIVCWSSSGGFRIYDKRRFESEIMPLYFKSKTHKVRKKEEWGYKCTVGGA
jgi:HSF-type DNA-binding